MAKIVKRLKEAYKTFDRDKTYTLSEAVKLVRANAKAKFDETIEVAMNLNVDAKKADQNIRGVVHSGVGRASFDDKSLIENIQAFVDVVTKARPAGAKGTYIKKMTLSSTMGPGVSFQLES